MAAHERLIEAAQQGDLNAAKAALDTGVDPNTRDPFEQTALIWAIMNGHTEVALAILDAGADPNLNGSMTPPLASAASQGNLDVVTRLLALGAEIDSNSKIFAEMNEHVEVLAKLNEVEAAKADGTWEQDAHRPMPTMEVPMIVAAAAQGRLEGIQIAIEQGLDLDACGRDGVTALMNAAAGNHADMVTALIDAGADLSRRENQMGFTPLLAAAVQGSADAMAVLLACGSDVNETTEDGFTALMYCSQRGSLSLVNTLLEAGADVNAMNVRDETALLRTAGAGSAEVIERLLAAGAEVDSKTDEGQTPLMIAADRGHLDAVKALLAGGANKDATGLALKTALDYARRNAHSEVVALLKPPDREVPVIEIPEVDAAVAEAATKALNDALWGNDLEAAVAALVSGAKVDGIGDDKPICSAAHAGHLDMVRLLVENGADVNAEDVAGVSALAKACGGAHEDMAKYLLNKGAAVTSTVMMAASIHSHPGILALLEASMSQKP